MNLADPDLFAAGGQYAAWRDRRRDAPVHREPAGFWSVTRHADVRTVLGDHHRFTSERGTLLNLLGKPDPAAGRQLAATDPPRHGPLRDPLRRVMGSRAGAALADTTTDQVRGLLTTDDKFDFAEVCRQLPLAVAGPLLGLPAADWPRLIHLVLMSSAEQDPDLQLPEGEAATLTRAHRELFDYFLDLVRHRSRHPGQDLVSLLLDTGAGGGEVVANCYSLLLGASATLPHVPSTLLAHLIDTDGYPAWAATGGGVEEALRWTSPASYFLRHTTTPVTLSGVDIPAGAAVVAWIGSANRDERVFADPDAFRPDRDAHRHLAFGTGHHYCLGAHLARPALRVFLAELAARFEAFEPAGEPERYRSTFLTGYKRLPVTGTPADRGTMTTPLTYAQRLLRMGETAVPGYTTRPGFTLRRAYALSRPADTATLRAALDDLVATHEALRTVVGEDEQWIGPGAPVPLGAHPELGVRDLVALAEHDPRCPLRAYLGHDDGRDVLLLVVDRAAVDDWSTHVLARDLVAAYTARVRGEPGPRAPMQYREIAADDFSPTWQRTITGALPYWRDQLAGLPGPDSATRAVPAYLTHTFTVPSRVWTGLAERARRARSTPFPALLAAFLTATGSPVAPVLTVGRIPSEWDTVGFLANLLWIRADGAPDPERLDAACRAAYTHDIPFHRVHQAVPEVAGFLRPTFQFQPPSPVRPVADPALTLTPVPILAPDPPALPVPLLWTMRPRRGEITYDLRHHDPATVAEWATAFQRTLAVLAEPR